jgi:enoyl-CoA hydratase/carnithine racemase
LAFDVNVPAYDPNAAPFEGVDVSFHDRVLTIRIDRVHVHNAITIDHMRYVGAVCRWAEHNDDVRCVVVTGTDRVFCAGADLGGSDIGALEAPPPIDAEQADLFGPVRELNKPTIAAVNGAAAGGGLGLALCCDVRIASEHAKFATSFTRIGVPGNDTVPWLLPRLIGHSRALEMLYDPRPIDAGEAARIGLVSYIVPHEELGTRADELARRFAAGPPYAIRHTKRLVLEGLSRSYRDYVILQDYANLAARVAAGNDIAEGVAAFLEKRPPDFTGPEGPS